MSIMPRGITTSREVIPQWTVHLIAADDPAAAGVNVDMAGPDGVSIPHEFLAFGMPNGDTILFVLPEPTKADLLKELAGGSLEVVQGGRVDQVVRQLERDRQPARA